LAYASRRWDQKNVLCELGIRGLPIESGGGGTAGSLFYEGWHTRIAANKAAANAQTKISTHWSRDIRGSIEKGPTNPREAVVGPGAEHRRRPPVLKGRRNPILQRFAAIW
jgi:hypothetical protein